MHDPNAVLNPDPRIMEVLLGLMGWARKTYVYPSQVKILELLRNFTGRVMSRRSLNRHLRALERDHHVRRQRRAPANAGGELTPRTTLYFPCGRYLARAERLARGLMGWARARTQRDASRKVTRSAHNRAQQAAVERSEAVDNRGPP